jgi:pimeloyl-ACP methyl ester carboxylesterase
MLMLVDLIQTTTRDGVRLDGVYQAATSPSAGGIDAVAFIHGTGGSFYSSTLFDALAETFLSMGVGVLRVNTRGHDLMSNAALVQGARRAGAAYEMVDDCRHDLAAWSDWLRRNVGPRIGLLGHSLGAVKCLYALAMEPDFSTIALIAVSPPRLSHSWFVAGPKKEEFLATYHQARDLVAAREGGTLIEVSVPLPFLISAAGFVEKYGPDEHYNFLNFAPKVACRTLFAFGSAEVAGHPAFQGAPEAIEATTRGLDRFTCRVVDGADHFYTGVRERLAGLIVEWLRGS